MARPGGPDVITPKDRAAIDKEMRKHQHLREFQRKYKPTPGDAIGKFLGKAIKSVLAPPPATATVKGRTAPTQALASANMIGSIASLGRATFGSSKTLAEMFEGLVSKRGLRVVKGRPVDPEEFGIEANRIPWIVNRRTGQVATGRGLLHKDLYKDVGVFDRPLHDWAEGWLYNPGLRQYQIEVASKGMSRFAQDRNVNFHLLLKHLLRDVPDEAIRLPDPPLFLRGGGS